MLWRLWRRAPRVSSELARLERKLARMDSVTREVFLLHRLDSLGYPEIAERLKIDVAEVQQRIAEAMSQLVQAIADD
jgi:DNA-directed RNA polymerase specialized sigma24 family protein